MCKLFSLFALSILSLCVNGQIPGVKESQEVSYSFSEASVYKTNNEFVYILYGHPYRYYNNETELFHPQKLKPYDEGILNKYDKNFKLLTTYDLGKDLKDQIIEGVFMKKQKLYGFISDKSKNDGATFLQEISAATCSWTGNKTQVLKNHSRIDQLYTSFSIDSVYNLVVAAYDQKNKEAKAFTGILLNDFQAEGVQFDFSLNVTSKELSFFQFFPVNGQEFCVVYGAKMKESGDDNLHYYMNRFDYKGKLKETREIEFGNLAPDQLAFRRKNDLILFWGMYSSGKEKNNTGFLSGRVNLTNFKTDKPVITEFNAMPSLKEDGKYYKSIAEDGLDKGFPIRNFYLNTDSSFYLIYEDGYKSMSNDYFTGSNSNMRVSNNSYSSKNFLRGDAVVIKVNSKGQAEWVRVIPKKQSEMDFSTREGIVTAVDGKKNLHLVFNDNNKNTDIEPSRKPALADITAIGSTSLFQVIITPSGIATKQLLYENNERETYFSPDYSVGIGNEIYFSANHTRALKKSSYTFGVMKF